MTTIIRVAVDGTVTRYDSTNLLATANAEWPNSAEIVSIQTHEHAPFPDDVDARRLVAMVNEFGRANELPVNVKAWSLYGRSPIFGDAFLAYDQDEDGTRAALPDEWIDAITGDPVWISPTTRDAMRRALYLDDIPVPPLLAELPSFTGWTTIEGLKTGDNRRPPQFPPIPDADRAKFAAMSALIGRTGATELQVRYSDADADQAPTPTVWLAVAVYPDGRFDAAAGTDALIALRRLCTQIIDGAECAHCHRPAGFDDDYDDTVNVAITGDTVCWYMWDPELGTYRRGCE